MQVDPRFRQMGQRARQRRRKSFALRGVLSGLGVLLVAGAGWWQFSPQLGALWTEWFDQTQMTQVEAEFDIAPVTHGAGFTDIPGDPMFIPRTRKDAASEGQLMPAPAALMQASYGGGSSQIAVLKTDLRTPDLQRVAALPSSREELAMFQAERSRARGSQPAAEDPAPAPVLDPDQPIVSGTVFLREPARRTPLWTDTIVETTTPRPLAELLAANGISLSEAERAAARFETAFGTGAEIAPGSVLALRYRGDEAARQIIQLALYDRAAGYLGSMAMAGSGQLVASADAFTDQGLLPGSEDGKDGEFQPQRLLDMIYSAALRSNLTPDEAGTALAMMAKIHDLDGFADPEDKLTIIRARATGGIPGPVLFIGVDGPSGDKPCYIVEDAASGDGTGGPGCFSRRQVAGTAGGAGLTPPVAGVMSQRFVPMGEAGDGAKDGELLRGHVVWSAPQGSPVRAAGAGTVTAMGEDKTYGPSVEITHQDGAITRYRGLGGIAASVAQGARVEAGAEIGTVGNPPGQDQPGLIFQLVEKGEPVDPSRQIGGAVEVAGSNAVEALIAQIIRVESGGNARARNPLSTASGLGQFIESTWLRMMRTYRPDLVASMSRAELLELRFDAAMSREMVRRLAQENEAYLRARGHEISSGRLYLAHFLGPAGADQALRADPGAMVLSVMGNGVVSANPFLRGYTIADLRNWAERKMGGARGDSGLPTVIEVPIPPQLQAVIAALDQIRHAI